MFFKFFLLPALLVYTFQTDTSRSESYEESIAGSDQSIAMTFIPGGKFKLGSPKNESGRNEDEGPQRELEVGDFWIGTYEITWDQYQLFLFRNVDKTPASDRGAIDLGVDAVSGATMPYVNYNKPGYPAIDITQYAASTFCKWLTAKTGRFYRLPTEAEWEFACRSGSTEAYSFGRNPADLNDYAWFKANSNGMIQRGGKKAPNSAGLYDMHGNAAEWVIDAYDEAGYQKLPTTDAVLFPTELYPRVVRGGSFRDGPEKLRSAARDYSRPQWKQRDPQFPKSLWWHTDALHVGFRIVRPKEEPSVEEMEKYWDKPIREY